MSSDKTFAEIAAEYEKSFASQSLIAAELVERIYEDLIAESCVLFLGAGSTTENPSTHGNFQKGIHKLCSSQDPVGETSFAKVMETFCVKIDGGQKNRLIRHAISYIEEFCLPGEAHTAALRACKLIAEIPLFRRFVTTNWDPFLERSLEVLVPTVEDRDVAFWDDSKRQVLKIHGCITRPYSIVATETDYSRCIQANPLVFNKLRDLMATKTFIFSGYSLNDSDFRTLWQSITDPLGRFARPAYSVNPRASAEDILYWRDHGVLIYETTDVAFLSALKKKLEDVGELPSADYLLALRGEHRRILQIHLRNGQNSAGKFASSMYQDGLLHSLESAFGTTSSGIRRKADFDRDRRQAEDEVQKAEEIEDIVELAYWTGRLVGVEYVCRRRTDKMLAYFHPEFLRPSARLVDGEQWDDSELNAEQHVGGV